jgi:hypothetical protein
LESEAKLVSGKSSPVARQYRNRFLSLDIASICANRAAALGAIRKDSINLPLCGGDTPLTRAVEYGDVAAIRSLIRRGAEPDLMDLKGCTPLIRAVFKGNQEALDALVKLGAGANQVDVSGRTALHYACYLGDRQLIHALVLAHADLQLADADGRTPLDYARASQPGKDERGVAELVESLGGESLPGRAWVPAAMRADKDYLRLDHVLRLLAKADLFESGRNVLIAMLAVVATLFVSNVLGLRFDGNGLLGPVTLHTVAVVALVGLATGLLLYRWSIINPSSDPAARHGSREILPLGIQQSARGVSEVLRLAGQRVATDFELVQPQALRHRSTYLWILVYCSLSILVLAIATALCVALVGGLGLLIFDFNSGLDSGPTAGALAGMIVVTLMWFVVAIVFAVSAILAVHLPGAIMLFMVLKIAAMLIERRIVARQKHMASIIASQSMSNSADNADTVLFLRSFTGDGIRRMGYFDFEALLAFALSRVGPLVAIGDAAGQLGPVMLPSTDDGWTADVRRLMQFSNSIVMVPADSPGVLWELVTLKDEGLLRKTVFVAPPGDGKDTHSADWERMRRHADLAEFEIPPYCESGFVFRLNRNGSLNSAGPLGLEIMPPPIVAPARQQPRRVGDPGDDDGGEDNGGADEGGGTVQSQAPWSGPNAASHAQLSLATAHAAMLAVPIVTAAEWAAATPSGDGGDGTDGGDAGNGGFDGSAGG